MSKSGLSPAPASCRADTVAYDIEGHNGPHSGVNFDTFLTLGHCATNHQSGQYRALILQWKLSLQHVAAISPKLRDDCTSPVGSTIHKVPAL
jgi:hypothetical protein